jgi:hypothetical protein
MNANDLIPEEEEVRLAFIMEHEYRRLLLEMHNLTRDALEADPSLFRLDDADTRALLAVSDERAVGMTQTTRAAVDLILKEAQAEGISTAAIDARIAELFEKTWKARPEIIASTEIAEAQRVAAINRYTASGMVDRVRISDANRGTNHTDTCLARNGTTVPLSEAPQLDHPLCSLVLIPVLKGER